MKYSAAFAWENKLLNGLQMQPVFLSLRSRVNGCGNPFSRLLVIARGFSPAAIRSLLREITDSFAQALRMTSWLVAANVTGCAVNCCSVIASTERCVAIRLSSKGITDSFTLRVQNDIPFRHCEAVQTAVAIRFPLLFAIAA